MLSYLRNKPGSSGEQVAEEMATDTATLRPVLIEGGAGQGHREGARDEVRGGVAGQRGLAASATLPGSHVSVCARGPPRQVWGYKPQGTDTATLRVSERACG